MSNELLRLWDIIAFNTDKIRKNGVELEQLTALKMCKGLKSVSAPLDRLLNDTNDLIKQTGDALRQLKTMSNLTEAQQTLSASMEERCIDALNRFVMAQRNCAPLLSRANHPSLTVSDEWMDATKETYDPAPSAPKREVLPVERKNVAKFSREPTQVPDNKDNAKINRDRNDQVVWRDIRFAPVRSLNDFLLDATWNVSDRGDDARVQNRLASNLIYYQTNYFIFGIVCFILTGIMFPVDFIITLSPFLVPLVSFSNVLSFVTGRGANSSVSSADQLHLSKPTRNYSALIFLISLGVAFYNLSLVNTLLIWFFGILFPIFAIHLHAVIRKRSFANKASNQLDRFRSRVTPMAIFLEMRNKPTDA